MTHHVLHVTADGHLPVLLDLVAAPGRTVVFTRTKHRAKKLARQLNGSGVPAVELHGNLSQNARTRTMDAFHSGAARTLVATDIAARGIHVDDVALVIHADPPVEHKAYLHRSGRTARAGASGTVITLMTDDQVRDVRDLTRKAGVQPHHHPGHLDPPAAAGARPRRALLRGRPRPARVHLVGPPGRRRWPRSQWRRPGRPAAAAARVAAPAQRSGRWQRPASSRRRCVVRAPGLGSPGIRPAGLVAPGPLGGVLLRGREPPLTLTARPRAVRPRATVASVMNWFEQVWSRVVPEQGVALSGHRRCSSCSSRPSWPWRSTRSGGCCASASPSCTSSATPASGC